MKAAFQAAGLPQVPYICGHASQLVETSAQHALVEAIESQLGYPCFVKPANLGSSVGISKARTREELLAGLKRRRHGSPPGGGAGGEGRELNVPSWGIDAAASVVGKSASTPIGTTTPPNTP